MSNSIGRIDAYTKHYFTQLIVWFTFFSTVNWASLGWLAVNYKSLENSSSFLVSIVAAAFAWKNLLGILMCAVVMVYFIKASSSLLVLEESEKQIDNIVNIFPIHLVIATCTGMILAIIPVMSIWVYIWGKLNAYWE